MIVFDRWLEGLELRLEIIMELDGPGRPRGARASGFASIFCRAACVRNSVRIKLSAWRVMLTAWARHFCASGSEIVGVLE